MKERSRLFNLLPEGMGTAGVECLTSYMSRLAEYHCVDLSKLLEVEISKELEKDFLKDLNRKRQYASSLYINGYSEVSLDYVKALEKLTTREDLINLTLLNWKGMVSRGLIVNKRVWCSICFHESKVLGNEIYEPLIWQINIMKYCPKHFTELESICPHCHKTNPLLSSKMRVGYCLKCSGWLGGESNKKISLEEWELWKIDNISSMLEQFQGLMSMPTSLINSAIVRKLKDVYSNGNLSSFSRTFELDRSQVGHWVSGRNSLSFVNLLKFSFFFNIPIVELLKYENIKIREINKWAINLFQKDESNDEIDFDPTKLRNELKSILDDKETPPLSMYEVIRRLNYSEFRLYKYGNDLCKQISAKRRSYLTQKKIEKKELIYLEVYRIVTKILDDGEVVSEWRIKDQLSFPVYYKELYEAMEKVFEDIKIEN